MTSAAVITTTLLALVALGFAAGAAWFLGKSRVAARKLRSDGAWPKAAVLLALKGTDAYLTDAMRSLLRQDYPDYQIRIVVDSEDDPAWGIVTRVIEEEGPTNVHVATLREPLFTCSLKCSALLQMLSEVDPDVEILALIDGDVVPHRGWLRQLAAPLANPDVGASFGIPWYFPQQAEWPAVARKVCWTPAAVLMLLCGWIWGGSAALTSRVFRDPALAERWSRSVSSDASIRDVIEGNNLRMEWAPALVMPNYESTRFDGLVNQLARSLATSRLYLNRWPVTLLVVVLAASSLIMAAVVFISSLLTSSAAGLIVSAAGLGGYLLILMVLLLMVEGRALKITKSNGAVIPPLTLRALGKILISIPLAHGLYLVSAVKAQFVRSLTWRGVRYAINGKLDVLRVAPEAHADTPVRARHVLVRNQTREISDPVPLKLDPLPYSRWRQMLFRSKEHAPDQSTQRVVAGSDLSRESVESDSW